MEEFLLASKAALLNLSSYKKIIIVLGNETCDLDSAVCALVRAFNEHLNGRKNGRTRVAVIPVLNIPAKEFRVKTEVVYYLERHDISRKLLTFRDEIDLKELVKKKCAEIILVDHHALGVDEVFLADSVIEVIDHRPRDASWPWENRTVYMETVGSCATLVARNLISQHPESVDAQISSLLRGPILVDTCNFSKEADRATPTDVEMINALEKLGNIETDRTVVYDEIVAAKTDISGLTPDDLMIRDLKVVAGIPIVGLPMLVENFLTLDNELEAVKNFAETRDTTVVVIVGLDQTRPKVERDIAVFSLIGDHVGDKIRQALTSSTQPSLELTLSKEVHQREEGYDLFHYKQGNLRATRKQIVPIVRGAVSDRG